MGIMIYTMIYWDPIRQQLPIPGAWWETLDTDRKPGDQWLSDTSLSGYLAQNIGKWEPGRVVIYSLLFSEEKNTSLME